MSSWEQRVSRCSHSCPRSAFAQLCPLAAKETSALSGLCWAGTREEPEGSLGASFVFSDAHVC